MLLLDNAIPLSKLSPSCFTTSMPVESIPTPPSILTRSVKVFSPISLPEETRAVLPMCTLNVLLPKPLIYLYLNIVKIKIFIRKYDHLCIIFFTKYATIPINPNRAITMITISRADCLFFLLPLFLPSPSPSPSPFTRLLPPPPP